MGTSGSHARAPSPVSKRSGTLNSKESLSPPPPRPARSKVDRLRLGILKRPPQGGGGGGGGGIAEGKHTRARFHRPAAGTAAAVVARGGGTGGGTGTGTSGTSGTSGGSGSFLRENRLSKSRSESQIAEWAALEEKVKELLEVSNAKDDEIDNLRSALEDARAKQFPVAFGGKIGRAGSRNEPGSLADRMDEEEEVEDEEEEEEDSERRNGGRRRRRRRTRGSDGSWSRGDDDGSDDEDGGDERVEALEAAFAQKVRDKEEACARLAEQKRQLQLELRRVDAENRTLRRRLQETEPGGGAPHSTDSSSMESLRSVSVGDVRPCRKAPSFAGPDPAAPDDSLWSAVGRSIGTAERGGAPGGGAAAALAARAEREEELRQLSQEKERLCVERAALVSALCQQGERVARLARENARLRRLLDRAGAAGGPWPGEHGEEEDEEEEERSDETWGGFPGSPHPAESLDSVSARSSASDVTPRRGGGGAAVPWAGSARERPGGRRRADARSPLGGPGDDAASRGARTDSGSSALLCQSPGSGVLAGVELEQLLEIQTQLSESLLAAEQECREARATVAALSRRERSDLAAARGSRTPGEGRGAGREGPLPTPAPRQLLKGGRPGRERSATPDGAPALRSAHTQTEEAREARAVPSGANDGDEEDGDVKRGRAEVGRLREAMAQLQAQRETQQLEMERRVEELSDALQERQSEAARLQEELVSTRSQLRGEDQRREQQLHREIERLGREKEELLEKQQASSRSQLQAESQQREQQLRQEVERLGRENEELQTELGAARQQLQHREERLSREIEMLRLEKEGQEKMLSSTKSQLEGTAQLREEELTREMEKLRSEKQELEKKLTSSKSQLQAKSQQREQQLRLEVERLGREKEELQKELEAARSQLQVRVRHLEEELRQEVERLGREKEELEKQLGSSRSQLQAEAQQREQQLRQEVEKLGREREELQGELEVARQQLRSEAARHESQLGLAVDKLRSEKEGAERELASSRSQLHGQAQLREAELAREAGALREEKEALRAELSGARARLAEEAADHAAELARAGAELRQGRADLERGLRAAAEARARQAELSRAVESLRLDKDGLEKELSAAGTRLQGEAERREQELSRAAEALRLDKAALEERVAALQQQRLRRDEAAARTVEELRRENDGLRGELSAAAAAVARSPPREEERGLGQERDKLRGELGALRGEKAGLEAELARLWEGLDELEDEVEQHRALRRHGDHRLAEMQGATQKLEDEKLSLEKQLKVLEKKMKDDADEWRQFQADLQVAVVIANDIKEEAEEEVASLRRRLQEATSAGPLHDGARPEETASGGHNGTVGDGAATPAPATRTRPNPGTANPKPALKPRGPPGNRDEVGGAAKGGSPTPALPGAVKTPPAATVAPTQRPSHNGSAAPSWSALPLKERKPSVSDRAAQGGERSDGAPLSPGVSPPASQCSSPTGSTPYGTPRDEHGDPLAELARLYGGSKRNALLKWCQKRTQNYSNVDITNFSSSWSDGLALCALVHSFLPAHIPYAELSSASKKRNFTLAFEAAESVGVLTTLDANNLVHSDRPDWQSIMGYVTSIYKNFET
ncbi:cytospin-A-like isoform X2 [Lethenteron reissneri]|uniref:cytospin-A-like isoform X2 n=1 Tax=Lethenteron reissneri TaxID=7753 RepID=UPI002AB6EE6E|nr:cytospin-A-like isoform X2 [Lethenteron reissneri]